MLWSWVLPFPLVASPSFLEQGSSIQEASRDFGHERVAGSILSVAGEQNNTSLDRRQSRMSKRRIMHNFYISRHMQTHPFLLP
jgi:hypothetical protein